MAEAPTIHVDIVSAEGELFSGPATSGVRARSRRASSASAAPRTAAVAAEGGSSAHARRPDGQEHFFFVGGGALEVQPTRSPCSLIRRCAPRTSTRRRRSPPGSAPRRPCGTGRAISPRPRRSPSCRACRGPAESARAAAQAPGLIPGPASPDPQSPSRALPGPAAPGGFAALARNLRTGLALLAPAAPLAGAARASSFDQVAMLLLLNLVLVGAARRAARRAARAAGARWPVRLGVLPAARARPPARSWRAYRAGRPTRARCWSPCCRSTPFVLVLLLARSAICRCCAPVRC